MPTKPSKDQSPEPSVDPAAAVNDIWLKFKRWRMKARLKRQARKLGIRLPDHSAYEKKPADEPTPTVHQIENTPRSSSSHINQLKRASEVLEKNQQRLDQAQRKRRSSPDYTKIRIPQFSSSYFYRYSLRIWNILFYSLAIDLFIAYVIPTIPTSQSVITRIEYFLFGTLAVTLLFSAREAMISLLNWFRDFQERLVEYTKRHRWIAISVLALIVVLEIGTKLLNARSLLFVIPAIIIALCAFYSLWKDIQTTKALQQRFSEDKIFWIEHLNRQYFFLALVPLITNRLASVFALMNAAHDPDPFLSYVPWGLAIFIFMIGIKPKTEQFMCNCRGCSAKTSRALELLGYCPRCAPQEFEVATIGAKAEA